jgi:hypothetical protein
MSDRKQTITETVRIPVEMDHYVNVSAGATNCTLAVATGSKLRVVVGGSQPGAENSNYVVVRGPGTSDLRMASLTVRNLQLESDVWAMAEGTPTEVVVVRGPATLTVSA